ncbi:MAG: hypothetical protein J4F35_12040 [Candidatus Latescibacteria bacterium]|nr:hypothetical protein [Candidatus Latescibacterota bacterium]
MENQEKLKQELQKVPKASKLEDLAAALIGRLLDVPIAVAKSGFQHGADAGPAGQQGRRFRIECKKYSDTTDLNERELLGEVDQALMRNEALEAWVLVVTRSVSEQIRQSLNQHGERLGVPVLIIDWIDHEVAPLAALCAFAPDLVEREFSQEAGAAACALQPMSEEAIERLRRDLQSWCLGFEAIRARSHDKLDEIWNSSRESKAVLGQDVAGGAQQKKVKRSAVHEALNKWWQGAARDDAPAGVVGLEGAGKTWATLDWLIDSKDEQPIVLMIPSSTAATVSNVSETSVKQLLADRLYEMSRGSVRNHEHWLRRLDRLLARPADEGPVLTVFLDGLNQEPSVPWLLVMKVLQGDIFTGRVRVIVSTRTHHFEEKLSGLRDLAVLAERVDVDLYDTAPGSELDQMLAFENLTQADLHPDVIEWARKPRLFKLVVRFRDRLVQAGQITVHRLLWEYGRDAFGERAGKSFSENEWKDWLKEIAQSRRQGMEKYSERSLGKMVNRPDFNKNEVYARLSDIIDGRFATRSASGDLQLTPAVVAHALGIALLNHLDQVTSPTFETLDATLGEWLDSIAGLDEQAEILRAAVSILVEQGRAAEAPGPGVLVTAWLQSQNIPDEHRQELVDLAPHFPNALLDAIEYSNSHAHNSARVWAVNALSKISRDDSAVLDMIVERSCCWLGVVSYDGDRRSDRLKRLIGIDTPGPITVVGVDLKLVDQSSGLLKAVVPLIAEGFPLANALPIFETAAVALEVGDRSSCWDGLKWLCLLNEVDSDETATALRGLSEEISRRQPEQGVHPDLPKRIAALLLWLTGQDEDEDAAVSMDPGIDRPLTYEKDYLPQPGRSWFPLERRHAQSVLTDTELPLYSRVQRTTELWLDPSFGPPASFVEEVRAAATCIDVEKLNRHGDLTSEDDDFERLEPVLARCAPDLLADLIRRKMRSMATCPPESRHWSAIHATDHLVLAGEDEAAAARALRLSVEDEEDDASDANNLLLIELRNLDAQDQFDELIHADLKYISTNFAKILRPPTPNDVDGLIARYADGSLKQQRDLLTLLSIHPVELTDTAWSWVKEYAECQDDDSRGFAFRILTHADPVRFGQTLEADGWSWKPDEHDWVNDYGTDALIKATLDIPFDQLAPRLAPWWLLEAVRQRGVAPTEVRLAAKIFGQLLDGKHRSEAISYCAEDFVPVLQHAPDIVEQWLEGCTEVTTDFQHRIFFAGRAYIALCEALLAHDPERGAPLWKTLRATMITRYIGAGGVEDLLHMVFRVPDSPAVKALRKELVELEHCHTDQALFNLAIAASCNGKDDWLATLIEQDQASKFAWRRERAAVLASFTANNTLPVEGAWPDREIKTGYADLAQKAARYRWAEACARHWRREYLASSNPTEAYAAWVLFLSSADRRCWAWMNQDIEAAQESDDFFKLKMIHARLNQGKLENALKKREDKLDKNFLDRRVFEGVGPWPKYVPS